MARIDRAIGGGEQLEAGGDPARDLLGRERAHARRRKLDGERKTVETPADLGHGRRVAVVDLEAR